MISDFTFSRDEHILGSKENIDDNMESSRSNHIIGKKKSIKTSISF